MADKIVTVQTAAGDVRHRYVDHGTYDAEAVDVVAIATESGTAAQPADITVDATAGGVVLLAASATRTSSTIQNTGSANLRIRVDGNPSATQGFQLAPGQTISFSPPESKLAHKAIRESSTSTTASVSEVA